VPEIALRSGGHPQAATAHLRRHEPDADNHPWPFGCYFARAIQASTLEA